MASTTATEIDAALAARREAVRTANVASVRYVRLVAETEDAKKAESEAWMAVSAAQAALTRALANEDEAARIAAQEDSRG